MPRSLLTEGGIMILSFEAQKPYVADRMAGVLGEVFGHSPICFRVPTTAYGWGGLIFVAGNEAVVRDRIKANPRLETQIARWQRESPVALSGTTPIATDDWPYIYLDRPRIPQLYYLLTGLLAVLMVRGLAGMGGRHRIARWDRPQWHFFLLGAAFMLLEVQNISKAAVVLGNTWSVNAVIISGILAMVLLANLVVARLPSLPAWLIYTGLCGACLLNYGLDLSRFAFLPYASKVAIVGVLTSLPMLFSGIAFARSFTAAAHKDRTLGANLIGALIGGLLQSITFVTGIRALLLIVTGLYLLAFATRPRPREVAWPSPVPTPVSSSSAVTFRRKSQPA